jgi:hypothetical protein
VRRTTSGALVVAGCAVLLAGCSSAQKSDVEHVARVFEDQGADPAQRCDLLAPSTRTTFEKDASTSCPTAIGEVELPGGAVRSVSIWGGDAQVKLAGDTLFLTQTSAGWRIAAAGCQPQGEEPYDCLVEGP